MANMAGDLHDVREQMLEEHLRARGIRDERVLAAVRSVPRQNFVEPEDVSIAYDDRALPIGCGQTISQPYIVALMTEAIQATPGMRILEIGTGSGYQAAILAWLGMDVFTVERHPQLAEISQQRLNQNGFGGVHVRVGDGRLGWTEHAPYDRVMITAATDEIPPAVWEQLTEGGRLIAPLGGAHEQTLEIVRKVAGRPQRTPLVGCRFVPLLPGVSGA